MAIMAGFPEEAQPSASGVVVDDDGGGERE